ncbi:MAG TPA: phosphoribosyltransferase family protein [Usitatibacter sp.]|nr:phosphoribosyltransferase family protein [Usitatibacter sp.]
MAALAPRRGEALVFEDRIDAARRLAAALAPYAGRRPVIYAIPRGAVPMAAELARQLQGDLDVVLVRKLGAPHNPELAVGAVDDSGWSYVSDFAAQVGANAAYLEGEKRRQLELLAARRARYTPGRRGVDPGGRVAIVVDDGLATGATMIAALHSVRARRPARLVCAVPVASPEGLAKVEPYADEVVCLSAPADFGAVGRFYRDFAQVSDEEVEGILAHAAPGREMR